MSFLDALRMALSSLRTNKMRSALTLLGVIIGIAAVIIIVTLGRALQASVEADLDKLGANNFAAKIMERPAEGEEEDPVDPYGSAVSGVDAASMITPDMLERLTEAMGDQITGIIIGEYASYDGKLYTDSPTASTKILVRPTNPGYIMASQYTAVAGRLLSEEDIAAQRAVALLSTETAEALFGSPAAAVGQSLSFEPSAAPPLDLVIIGVYAKPRTGPLIDTGPIEVALVPYPLEAELSTAPGAGEGFTDLSIRGNSTADKLAVAQNLQRVFDGFYADNPDYYVKVTDFSEDIASLNQMFALMSLVLGAIGGISLLVGGIGVMNIMLITVTERTHEIGIRKAMGARRRDIRRQFIMEAVIICLFGGLLGIIIGAGAGMAGAAAMGSFVFPPLSAILVSLLFALLIGLFFGSYPAGKAAKLDPIEALRYE